MKNNKSSSKILKNEYDAWRGKIIFTTFYSKSLFFYLFILNIYIFCHISPQIRLFSVKINS